MLDHRAAPIVRQDKLDTVARIRQMADELA
jgi:hypothetical protein